MEGSSKGGLYDMMDAGRELKGVGVGVVGGVGVWDRYPKKGFPVKGSMVNVMGEFKRGA